MLRLRRMKGSDIYKVMEWRMLPEVTKYMYTDVKLTKESQKAWFLRMAKSAEHIYWIIEFDGTDIGVINLCEIDKTNNRCSWAYYIADTSFRGKGIARNLECNIYDYVFGRLDMNKLCCEVFEDNDAVVQIHKKFGSKVEGVFVDHIFKDGVYKNVVRMAILKREWKAIKGGYTYEVIEIE